MAEALGLGVSLGGDGLDIFKITLHRFSEGLILMSGPKNDSSTGAEGFCNHTEAFLGVEAGVAFLHQRVGAVVDIEEDGVVGAWAIFTDDLCLLYTSPSPRD